MVDHWNCATKLPTPDIPLIIEDVNGQLWKGSRPDYIREIDKQMQGDLGYRSNRGNPVIAKRWQYA